jgi:hypothetical protein
VEKGKQKWKGEREEANKVINFKLLRVKRILSTFYCQRNEEPYSCP